MHGKSGVSGRNVGGVPQVLASFKFSPEFFPDKLTGLQRVPKKRRGREDNSKPMLRAIVAVLLILWLLGFVLHIAGGVIHLLAVIAIVVLIYDLVARKKPVS